MASLKRLFAQDLDDEEEDDDYVPRPFRPEPSPRQILTFKRSCEKCGAKPVQLTVRGRTILEIACSPCGHVAFP